MRNKAFKKYPITEQEIMPFEDQIRPDRFQVLILFAQGYTYKQMTAYLQVPPGTVKSRLARGRVDLKKLITMEETEIKELYDGAAA